MVARLLSRYWPVDERLQIGVLLNHLANQNDEVFFTAR
jgi:hypothetical protein